MTELVPPTDDDEVPDHVLDELRLVFGDPTDVAAPNLPAVVDGDLTQATDADGDVLVVDQSVVHPSAEDPSATSTGAIETGPTSAVAEPDRRMPASDGQSAEQAAARATIVIGGDDSLPDAVYLDEGELGPLSRPGLSDASGRSTIVIGDELDSSGVFDAVAVPSRSMDPRVRARRIAVKRARGRKRLLWAGVAAVVLLIAVAVLAVFSSSLFAVDQVDVQGAAYTRFTDSERLQVIVDDVMGQPVLLLDTLAIERQLETIPWIERAFVSKDFPNRVLIDVRERRPLATFRGSDGRYRVIDHDGRVLAVLDGRPTDYMLLTGPAPDTEAGGLAGTPFAAAAQMVGALPSEIRALTVTASVYATTSDLGLMIQRPASATSPDGTSTDASGSGGGSAASDDREIEVRIGSSARLDSKLARLLQLIRNGLDGVVRIDVSTDQVSVTKG